MHLFNSSLNMVSASVHTGCSEIIQILIFCHILSHPHLFTVETGKLDKSVPNLFVLTSQGDLTSGSHNVTSEQGWICRLPVASENTTVCGVAPVPA